MELTYIDVEVCLKGRKAKSQKPEKGNNLGTKTKIMGAYLVPPNSNS